MPKNKNRSAFEEVLIKKEIKEAAEILKNFIIYGYSDELELDSNRTYPSTVLMFELRKSKEEIKERFNQILIILAKELISENNPKYIEELIILLTTFRISGSIEYLCDLIKNNKFEDFPDYKLKYLTFRALISLEESYDDIRVRNQLINELNKDILDKFLVPQIIVLSKKWDDILKQNVGNLTKILKWAETDIRWQRLFAKSFDVLYSNMNKIAFASLINSISRELNNDKHFLTNIIENSTVFDIIPIQGAKWEQVRGIRFVNKTQEFSFPVIFEEFWVPSKDATLNFFRNISKYQYDTLFNTLQKGRPGYIHRQVRGLTK